MVQAGRCLGHRRSAVPAVKGKEEELSSGTLCKGKMVQGITFFQEPLSQLHTWKVGMALMPSSPARSWHHTQKLISLHIHSKQKTCLAPCSTCNTLPAAQACGCLSTGKYREQEKTGQKASLHECRILPVVSMMQAQRQARCKWAGKAEGQMAACSIRSTRRLLTGKRAMLWGPPHCLQSCG